MCRECLSFKLFRATFVSSISLERPEVHPTAEVSWLRNNSTIPNPRVIDLTAMKHPSTHSSMHKPQFRSFFFFFFSLENFLPFLASISDRFLLCTMLTYRTYRLNQTRGHPDVKIRSHKSVSSIQSSRFYRRDRGSARSSNPFGSWWTFIYRFTHTHIYISLATWPWNIPRKNLFFFIQLSTDSKVVCEQCRTSK